MPYLIPPQKSGETGFQDYVWYQKATATKPAAIVLEIWGGQTLKPLATPAQEKKWAAFKFPKKSVSSVRKTVAAYKKKGYVVVTNEDIAKLFKEYVPRSYAAAIKSKKINPKSKYSFVKDGSQWAESFAPMHHIWDKPSVVSVYNQFLKSMTWGGKKPKNSPKSPASYFWGWGRTLDFNDGSHSVIPMAYGSDTVMLHNYKTGKVAVVTDCEGDDDEAGEYAMSVVAFEWKMNPKLVAAMNKPIQSGKNTGRGVKKPAAKKPKAKPRAKAPKTKKGFNWVDLDDEKTAEHPRETLTKSVKKATQDGWKQVSWMQSGGKREKQIWGKMAQSPQWNAWVKDFTARCKYEQIMSETYMVFNGTAHWKDTYDPDHMGEEGEWTILTKDNKVLLFYYYSDWENNTTVMRKTFTVPTKPVAKAKAKAKPKAKPKAKAPKSKGFNYISSESGWPKTGTRTIEKTTKQYQQDGWKKLTHRAKIGSQIWNRIGKSPEYKSWVQKLSQMDSNSYDNLLSDDLYYMKNGFGHSKPDGYFHSPHFGEDGGYEILTKGNKILLLFYIGDFDHPMCTPLMKKTFTMPTKPVAKAKPKPKPRAKAPAKPKPKAKAKPKAKPKAKQSRPSPSQSAAATKVGTRKRGNDGFMWEVKTNKNKVHRWARDTKSTKRAEDYWHWKV
jgi:hypothetical protein